MADLDVNITEAHCPQSAVRPGRRFTPYRWALAGLGLVCVGVGALGVFVPGLPTTIFLIAASYLFTRSCPWLEQRLIRNRFFGPFLSCLDGAQPMPRRAVVAALLLMWSFSALGTIVLYRTTALPIALLVPIAAAIGTIFVIRCGQPRPRHQDSAAA